MYVYSDKTEIIFMNKDTIFGIDLCFNPHFIMDHRLKQYSW